MSSEGFTLHTLSRVLKASTSSMISVFFGQPHLGYLIFKQGLGLHGSQTGHLRVVLVFVRILWSFFSRGKQKEMVVGL